nr:alpha/beta hydrolase [Microbacterium pseudoresistens]
MSATVPHVRRSTMTLADDRELSALRFGDDPPLVTFLHGAGLNAHTWDATILALGLPALAIDLPGHGDSSWKDDADYAGGSLAADVAAGLDEWTEQPQIVVGQSLGGLTGAALAAERPDLVRELVIIDITPGIDTSGGPAALRAFYAVTDFASREELVEHALSFGLGGNRANTERGVFLNSRIRDDGRVEWKHHFARLASRAFAAPSPADTAPQASPGAAPVLRDSGWDDLAAVTAPITLVRAEQGFVSAGDADEFARRLPDAAVLSVDAPHNAQETAARELAEIIRAAVQPDSTEQPHPTERITP